MMVRGGCLLLESINGWRLGRADGPDADWRDVPGGGEVAAEELADAAEQFVADHRLAGGRVVMALASTSALCVGFDADPADVRQRRLLVYQLEEALPLAAEQFVADFVVEGGHVLGVAADLARLEPLVAALERRGLRVQSIVPAAMLALEALQATANDRAPGLVVLQGDAGLEAFSVGRQLRDWQHLPADAEALARHLAVEALRSPGPLAVRLINVPPELAVGPSAMPELRCAVQTAEPFAESVRRGAAAVLAGRRPPAVELRRGALSAGDPYRAVRSAAGWCVASAAVCLLGATAYLGLRAAQDAEATEAVVQRQAALFQQAFPGAEPPAAIVGRLQSERQKLAGQRSDEAKVWLPPSGLSVLHALLAALPDSLPLEIEQVRIENGQIDLALEVRSVGEAGQLADALAQRGFVIEPPSTEQRAPQKVSVRLRGAIGGGDPAGRGERP